MRNLRITNTEVIKLKADSKCSIREALCSAHAFLLHYGLKQVDLEYNGYTFDIECHSSIREKENIYYKYLKLKENANS